MQGIAIDERVLMMWRKHFDGVPDALIDNTNILSEEAGNAALRLRRRFMRTGYVPRDVPETSTNVSSDLNDSIRILNFTRSDSEITERQCLTQLMKTILRLRMILVIQVR